MLSVVMDHCSKRWLVGIQQTQVYNFIFLSQMPIFMFVAGYFFYNNYIKEYSIYQICKKIINYFKSFLIPFFSFVIISTVINLDFKNFITNIVNAVLIPEKSLWFLWALMWIEIMMLLAFFISKKLFREVLKGFWKVCTSIAVYGCLLIPILGMYLKWPLYFETKLIIYYSIFFVVGLLFRVLSSQFKGLCDKRVIVMILLTSFIIVGIIMYNHPRILFENESIINMISRIIGSIAAIFLVWSIATLVSKKQSVVKLSKCGAYSLELYYMHSVLLCLPIFSNYLRFNSSITNVLAYLTLYCAVIAISFLLILILKKSKVLNIILFGKN